MLGPIHEVLALPHGVDRLAFVVVRLRTQHGKSQVGQPDHVHSVVACCALSRYAAASAWINRSLAGSGCPSRMKNSGSWVNRVVCGRGHRGTCRQARNVVRDRHQRIERHLLQNFDDFDRDAVSMTYGEPPRLHEQVRVVLPLQRGRRVLFVPFATLAMAVRT